MPYTVIEDCSPYYIRFTFLGLPEIIRYVKSQQIETSDYKNTYNHNTFNPLVGRNILKMLPMHDQFVWQDTRVSVFSTFPNCVSGIHKDGQHNRVSFNIPITVLDDKCNTYWYDDDSIKDFTVGGEPYTRRVMCNDYTADQLLPLKQMTATPNEMILFNTDIFHRWIIDRANAVLTIRTKSE